MRNKNTLIAIAALIIAAAALFSFSQSTGDMKMDHQGIWAQPQRVNLVVMKLCLHK